MWKRLRQIFNRQNEEDALLTLVQVALETPRIKEELLLILNQPSAERVRLINRWREQLKQESAPDVLVVAISMLIDDHRASKTLEILNTQYKQ